MLYRFGLILYVLVLFPFAAGAAENICYNCHASADFKDKVIHQPLTRGKCTGCHNPHVARYKGLLNEQGASLCYNCHDNIVEGEEPGKVHRPILQGQCLDCHEPHVSGRDGLLKADLESFCFKCHEDLVEKYDYTHQPFGRGECFSCHRPHKSEYEQLLKDEPEKVCLSCHNQSNLKSTHRNFPGGGDLRGCLTCHAPHGSERKGLIRNVLHKPFSKGCGECHDDAGSRPDTASCLGCHPEIAPRRFDIHNHITGEEVNSCVNCHSPHAADDASLLKDSQIKVCSNCHAETADRYRDYLYRHAEIEECSSCHLIHGSNEPAMLRGDNNEVCTRCHETQGTFTHPVGVKVRDPRSGQMVSCTTCHNPMGSDFEYQLVYSGTRDLCSQCHKSY